MGVIAGKITAKDKRRFRPKCARNWASSRAMLLSTAKPKPALKLQEHALGDWRSPESDEAFRDWTLSVGRRPT